MQNEKLNISLTGEKSELIIREVDKVNELEVKAPVKVSISGTIGAPFEFIKKRISEADQINQKRCNIIVDRQLGIIKLTTSENDYYNSGTIQGVLSNHNKLAEFGINTGKKWTPNELGQYFKMNRAFFVDKSENMKIVSDLKSFTAKVDTTISKQKQDNGSFEDTYAGIVTSNLPGAFKMKIPLFRGMQSEEIEIEIYASINGREVLLQLFSPGANQAVEEIRDSIIDEQISLISEFAPEIVIIEQ